MIFLCSGVALRLDFEPIVLADWRFMRVVTVAKMIESHSWRRERN